MHWYVKGWKAKQLVKLHKLGHFSLRFLKMGENIVLYDDHQILLYSRLYIVYLD